MSFLISTLMSLELCSLLYFRQADPQASRDSSFSASYLTMKALGLQTYNTAPGGMLLLGIELRSSHLFASGSLM